MEVNNSGIIYYFKKDKNENNNMFYERCRIAAKLKPKTELELKKSIQLSKIEINKKYLNSKYE